MALEDIFKSVILCSCGICCSKNTLCAKCEISTLKANGLSEDLNYEITGLSNVWPGNGGFKYSDLYYKLQKLAKNERI